MKRLSSSLDSLRDFFQEYGRWEEPFRDFLFYGKVKFTTVHTTFFMKDYQIDHFLYLFGVKELQVGPKEAFSRLKELSKGLISLSPDHYLSSFVLFVFEGRVPSLYSSKSIWLGFRGKVEWGMFSFEGGKLVYPPQMEGVGRFISSFLS
ncbi:hypothetical protein C7457_0357 [Thermovibrio guaymasensis]|uniref:Uncharacterized protein n=1 Tax=Thermovibrio guaymasensis TaxID=240167 RepID=A0A420W858_9BACT|nr:hypothetical protein [Thermovibrio guaymasensis]RKQ63484.1 hypothetical protein C7457_0357 [Thermovibrio guaymasensis]